MERSIEVLNHIQDHITTGIYGETILSVELDKALKDAATAMQKQIPCVVDSKTADEDVRIGRVVFLKGTTIYKCKCGGTILPSSIYCPDCGQKLDWGRKNEKPEKYH